MFSDFSQSSDDPSGWAVRAQIFNDGGSKSGAEFLVNSVTDGDQRNPAVTAVSGGGFVAVWNDLTLGGGLRGFGAQLFNSDGTSSGSQFLSTSGVGPTVGALNAGRYVIVWDDFTRSLHGQIFNSDGTPAGAEFGVNTTIRADGPQITLLRDGRFVVAWEDLSDTSGWAVRAQIFNPDGTKSGSSFLVNVTTAGDQLTPRIATLNDGDFITIWDSNSPGGQPYSVIGRVFIPSDLVGEDSTTPTPPVITSHNQTVSNGQQIALADIFSPIGNGITQYNVWFSWAGGGAPALGTLTNNGTAIPLSQPVIVNHLSDLVYTGSATPGTDKIWLQAYNGQWSNNGGWTEADILDVGARQSLTPDLVGSTLLINTSTFGSAGGYTPHPDIAVLANGDFAVVWSDLSNENSNGASGYNIRARVFSQNEQALGNDFLVNTTLNNEWFPSASALPGNGFVVAWQDATVPYNTDGTAIRARMFGAGGTPVDGSDFVVDAAGSARLDFPAITTLSNGSFAVTWSDGFSQVGGAIVANAGSSTPIQLDGNSSSDVAALSDGKFIVASANRTGVIAQIYSADGSLSGSELHLNEPGESARVAKLASGGFVVVWDDNDRIAEQVFDATGNAVGQQFTTASSDPLYTRNSSPAVAALPGGGFVVVWANTQGNEVFSRIQAQQYDATGAPVGDVFNLPGGASAYDPDGLQYEPSVAALPDGEFFVTWWGAHLSDRLNNTFRPDGVFAQAFVPLGVSLPAVVSANNETVAPGQHVALSDLFSITGSGITQYKVWYSWAGGGFPALGTLTDNGVAVPIQREVVLPSLDGLVYTGSSRPGTDKIWLQAYNGNWSNGWTEVDVTDPGAGAPVVTAARQTIEEGREVSLSDLFTVTGSGITQYKVWYSWPEGGAPAHGAVNNNGVPIPTDRWVSFASLDGLTYTGTTTSGTDSVWLIADNGTPSNQVRAYVTLTPGTAADAMFNDVHLIFSDLPTEMARLARDAYPGFFQNAGQYGPAFSLGSNIDPVAKSGLQHSHWHLVTSDELGLSFSLLFGTTYTYTDGFYQAQNFSGGDTLSGDTSEADAIVLTGLVNGQKTLAVAFAGTDQKSDWLDYADFSSHYAKFAPLVASLKSFVDANGIEKILVSGHSLGGAMAQEFMEDPDFLGSARYRNLATAFTFGSPGSDNISSDTPDGRITNFFHPSDPIYNYIPAVSHSKLLQDFVELLRDPILSPLGFTSEEADYVINKLQNGIQPKAHEGSDSEIAYMGAASGPLSQHVIPEYILDTAARTLTVNSGATVDIGSDFGATIQFAGNTGTLRIADSLTFAGTVAGMAGQDTIDFTDIDFAKVQQPAYSVHDASGGMLTVTDGAHTANVALLGNYLASTFVASSDGHGGTNVIDPPLASVAQQASLAPAHA